MHADNLTLMACYEMEWTVSPSSVVVIEEAEMHDCMLHFPAKRGRSHCNVYVAAQLYQRACCKEITLES